MKPPLFFMTIATQFENVGDALIHRELIRLAASHGPVVVDWSRCPEWFRETLDITRIPSVTTITDRTAFYRRILISRLHGKRCILLLKPGAYFGPRGFGELHAALVLGFNKLLALAGVEFMQFGASYERLDKANARFLRRKSRLYAAHFVRDEQSLYYARSLGMSISGLLPDLALAMLAENAPGSTARADGPITIGLSFRIGQFDGQEATILLFINLLVQTIGVEAIRRFVIVSQVEWDTTFADTLERIVSERFGIPVESVATWRSIAQTRETYAECDLIFSNRLHALLTGASVCPHVVGLVDGDANRKIVGAFEAIGWGDNLLDIRSLTPVTFRKFVAFVRANPVSGADAAAHLREGFASAIDPSHLPAHADKRIGHASSVSGTNA
ncbi:polysaccharide pyruvyl transferase family protein [Tsuneonella amylolytica]|uniref:polysaccharide pyruvyl transferase family protein n=1 Tax=Tsuneonella amylolytica TaxID=2338327 RepID=UPI0013C4391E|nr:polysaccharide pyruvyl transferase family protein [Tsuneonella amylolytica]